MYSGADRQTLPGRVRQSLPSRGSAGLRCFGARRVRGVWNRRHKPRRPPRDPASGLARPLRIPIHDNPRGRRPERI